VTSVIGGGVLRTAKTEGDSKHHIGEAGRRRETVAPILCKSGYLWKGTTEGYFIA